TFPFLLDATMPLAATTHGTTRSGRRYFGSARSHTAAIRGTCEAPGTLTGLQTHRTRTPSTWRCLTMMYSTAHILNQRLRRSFHGPCEVSFARAKASSEADGLKSGTVGGSRMLNGSTSAPTIQTTPHMYSARRALESIPTTTQGSTFHLRLELI